MSLAEIENKSRIYLNNSYLECEAGNADMPEKKNLANLSACIKSIKKGGTTIIPPEAGELTGIIIDSLPIKLDYNDGDTIDLTGLTVIATYDNNISAVVTSECEIIVDNILTVYSNSVTVKYQGYEASFEIKVYGNPEEIPSNAVYLYHFNNSKKNEIDNVEMSTVNNYVSTGKFNKSANGFYNTMSSIPTLNNLLRYSNKLTISFWIYFKKTGAYNYNSRNSYPFSYGHASAIRYTYAEGWISLNVSSNNELVYHGKTSYTYATDEGFLNRWTHIAITFNNGVVTLYVDGKQVVTHTFSVTSEWGYDGRVMHSQTEYAYIDELLITNNVLYTSDFIPPTGEYGGEKVLDKIYVEVPPKTIYQSGEYFSLSEAIIKAVFSNGNIVNVTKECVIENDTPILSTDKYRIIKYTYEGVTKKIYVNVGVYTVNEELNINGVNFLLPFDGTIKDITGKISTTIIGQDNYSALSEGKFGQSKYFNGSIDNNNYIEIPLTSDMTIGESDFTFSCWCKFNNNTSNNGIISCCHYIDSSIQYQGLYLWINSTGFCFCVDIDETTKNRCDTNYIPAVGIWTHVALVRKDGVVKLYIDGILRGTLDANGVVYQNQNATWKIGATNPRPSIINGEFFNGYIDDVLFSKTALWDGEFTPPNMPFSSIISTI